MDPLDFLQIASAWQKSPIEAERRTSIGRSYYALFLWTRERLAPFVRFERDADDHERAREYLKQSGDFILRGVAQALNNLRQERNDADYKVDVFCAGTKSESAYKTASAAKDRLAKMDDNTLERHLRKVRSIPKR